VYGYQKQADEYKATMETQFSTKEEGQFYNIATRRATVFNHTAASIDVTAPDRSAETNGNTSKAIGPAKMLQVSAGDRVQLEVFARYQTGTGGNNALISNLASAVTGSFLLNAGEAAHTAITNSVPTQAATISQTSGVPNSYLFYILFNSSYVYQQFGYVLVNSTAQAGHQQMYLDITVPTGGYLYTYVANESNVSAGVSVYYDDFTIVHTRSTPVLQVLQTSDYYPFGLQIAAGSYQKQTTLDNDYLYNGKELQDEHNLGWLDYGARMYMPEIGRFIRQDRFSEEYLNVTPYQYAANNPLLFVDINGDSIKTYFLDKNGHRSNAIPEAVQKMFNSEYGISVGYNSKTGMLYYTGEVETENTVSESAKETIVSALSDDVGGKKAVKKYGEIVFGDGNFSDRPPALTVTHGASNRRIAWINLDNFNKDGSSNKFDYSQLDALGISRRVFNLGRTFEHEWIGHVVNKKGDGLNELRPGPTVSIVNKFRREMGLEQRLNYGVPIYFSHQNSRSSFRMLRSEGMKGSIVPRLYYK